MANVINVAESPGQADSGEPGSRLDQLAGEVGGKEAEEEAEEHRRRGTEAVAKRRWRRKVVNHLLVRYNMYTERWMLIRFYYILIIYSEKNCFIYRDTMQRLNKLRFVFFVEILILEISHGFCCYYYSSVTRETAVRPTTPTTLLLLMAITQNEKCTWKISSNNREMEP